MQRIQKVQNQLTVKKLSAVLISKPVNVRYLCSFVGTNGRLLVTPKKATLITDFRYLRSAKKQLPKGVAIFEQKDGLKKLMGRLKTLGFEEEHVTQAQFKRLKKALHKITLKPVSGMVEQLRMIKDAGEMEIKRRACKMADECLGRLQKYIKPSVTENQLEWKLLSIARDLGAEGFSFPPIIGFGKDSADVHHIKKPNNKLQAGDMVLIDMGIEYRGYMTDMTRTFLGKETPAKMKKIYDIVLEANTKAIEAIEVGKSTGEIDRVARDIIKKSGYGDRFGHSTGHGVGMEVHEAPTVSEKATTKIEPGMIFTVEPGIYLDHLGGVRIEDEIYVNHKGTIEVLSQFSKKRCIL
jgi:Xaa-Pro aminopeptidase